MRRTAIPIPARPAATRPRRAIRGPNTSSWSKPRTAARIPACSASRTGSSSSSRTKRTTRSRTRNIGWCSPPARSARARAIRAAARVSKTCRRVRSRSRFRAFRAFPPLEHGRPSLPMSEHKGATDKTHVIQLESEILSARWRVGEVSAGGVASFEVLTRYVGNGAEAHLEFKTGSKKVGEQDAHVISDRCDGDFEVPDDAKGDLTFEIQLKKHKLK